MSPVLRIEKQRGVKCVLLLSLSRFCNEITEALYWSWHNTALGCEL